MRAAVQNAQAVRLGDGRVLAVGWDDDGVKTVAELWDPRTHRWRRTDDLPKNRSGFALVGLHDGRALLIGGINDVDESYSSAWAFDPARERWSKVGLMHTARTDPMAAVLADGRVLVAGGRFSSGPNSGATAIRLAAWRPSAHGSGRPPGPILADVDPGPSGRALATAELFDPRSGTWSKTGAMRYARTSAPESGPFRAVAVTLGDGRVLVYGTDLVAGVHEDTLSRMPAEIFDPATGTWSAAPRMPDVDPKALGARGIQPTHPAENYGDLVDLVALPDGDALLVGTRSRGFPMEVTRSLRFDTARDRWIEVGEPLIEVFDDEGNLVATYGDRHPDGSVAVMADGRVLVAGGEERPRAAELLDPRTGDWTSLPALPSRRFTSEAIALDDGSLLLIGTALNNGRANDKAYRFMPAR